MTNEQIVMELQEVKSTTESNEKRLDKLETIVENIRIENKAIYDLSATVKSLAESMADIKSDIKEVKVDVKDGQSNMTKKFNEELAPIKTDVEELKTKPLQTKSSIVDKIIWLVVSGVIAFIVTQVMNYFNH